MRSHVISIILYACALRTLAAELEKSTHALERCYRILLNISYKDHVTNEDVRRKIQAAVGIFNKLLTLVKRCCHISRSSVLAKTLLQDTVKRKRRIDKRKGVNTILRGGLRWTLAAEDITRWKRILVKSSVVPQRPRKVMESTRLD